ncbi:MAG TPA: histidine kinase dimerization/phosphoacceptor domain -containing protein [Rectinemataceae bacterium]|nr:histidine kinase dimerization/phosphoacceptor domain -containing protein [Rectinemataceae bacterium]
MSLLAAAMLATWIAAPIGAQPGSPNDVGILVLTSYGEGRPGILSVLSGFGSVLVDSGLSIENLYIEDLDLQRNPDPAYQDQLASLLRHKYLSRRIAAVYILEQPALDFFMSRLKGVAKGAPVIVARALLPPDAGKSGWHFVSQLESYDLRGTIALAVRLFPTRWRFILVSGNSESDKAVLASAEAITRELGPGKEVTDTLGMTLAEVDSLVEAPPEGSLIFILPYDLDASGRSTVQMEVAYSVAAEAKAPVFTLWDNPVGRGAIGGSVTEFTGVGRQAGSLVADILAGKTDASTLPASIPGPLALKVDWKAARRWGLSTWRLPSDIELVGKPPSLWQAYRGFVIAIAILLAAQSALIALLLIQRRRRLRAQRELADSESRFRSLVEQAPEAILVFDPASSRIAEANRMAEELFGLGRERLIGSDPRFFYPGKQPDGLPLEESFAANIARALSGETVAFKRALMNENGSEIVCEVRLARLPSNGRSLVRASFIDVSEREAAEQTIRAALKEKGALLSEVFHRTRNNMQVIMSLLSFQARATKGEEAAELLQKSIDRIAALALVQTKLYDAPNLSEIDLSEYLSELVASIAESPLFSGRQVLPLLRVESSPVNIDMAADLGIVFNELVSNAFEHAYPEGAGEVAIALAKGEGGGFELSVSDRGVGFPPGYDPRSRSSLGMQLVYEIGETKLGGKVNFESSDRGLTARFVFPGSGKREGNSRAFLE